MPLDTRPFQHAIGAPPSRVRGGSPEALPLVALTCSALICDMIIDSNIIRAPARIMFGMDDATCLGVRRSRYPILKFDVGARDGPCAVRFTR